MDSIEIKPVTAPIEASIRPPGSKSITNRALVCAALARGSSKLRGALDSDDTRVMVDSLRKLGIDVAKSDRGTQLDGGTRLDGRTQLTVTGCGGNIPARGADLFVGNSGTTIRFLTPVCALGKGRFTLDGIPRMRERPIGDLLAALRKLGVEAHGSDQPNFPPVSVVANGIRGGTTEVAGNISSQFLSGLLLAAPAAEADVEIAILGDLVSVPYVEMTVAVMHSFGVDVERQRSAFQVPATSYTASEYEIEPDASAASYFWAAAAVTGGRVEVQGLTKNALQGDVQFCDCLAQMGCHVEYGPDSIAVEGDALRGVDVDMRHISDTVQTLAVVALCAEGRTKIRNVENIRFKETDRLTALAAELRKLGATIVELPDGLEITPGAWQPASIATYDDHRMAMSFAVAGLVKPGLRIQDPSCVGKTYPNYFQDLEAIRP